MAVVTIISNGLNGVDMRGNDIALIPTREIIGAQNATRFGFGAVGDFNVVVLGSGFAGYTDFYGYPKVLPSTGMITSYTFNAISSNASTLYSGLHLSLATLLSFIALGGEAADTAFNNMVFAGADTIRGDLRADTLAGFAGNDMLDGRGGADTMLGGSGNDTYVVDNVGDITTESSSLDGIDLVNSSVTRTLGANLEKLTLTGAAVISGTGNTLANVITGNSAANTLSGLSGADRLNGGAGGDRLIGGAGLDILTGGGGGDKFFFNSAPSAANRDTITDYNVAADTIQIENAVFIGIGGVGVLAAAAFRSGAVAADASDRIIYNSATGALYFDADGAGGAAQIQFATLSAGLALTAADFVVI